MEEFNCIIFDEISIKQEFIPEDANGSSDEEVIQKKKLSRESRCEWEQRSVKVF